MKRSLAQSLPRQQGLPLNSFPPKFSVGLFFGVRSISPKIAFFFWYFLFGEAKRKVRDEGQRSLIEMLSVADPN